MTRPLVSLVVLNFDGRIYLRRLLRSLLAQTHAPLEILVVDNGSRDGSPAIVEQEFADPRVRLLRLRRNGGFSAGNNAGIRAARGAYVMLLNNDLELDPTCVERLVAAAEQRGRFGALAPKILWFHRPEYIESVGTMCTPDGTGFNHGVGHVDVGQFDRGEQVFGACFAAAFFRREAFDDVGLLDESYFMYYEDTDWNFRANRRGLPIYTVPEARVFHVHSGTLRYTAEGRKRYYLTRNRLRFCLLNMPGAVRQLLLWLRTLTPLRYWRLWLLPDEVWLRLRVGTHIGLRLPWLLVRRWRRRRDPHATVPDAEFLSLGRLRESFFVSDKLYPEPSFRALVSTMRELFRSRPTVENVLRLGHLLALRHLVDWRPTPAAARAALDAWAATLGDVPNRTELLRLTETVPELDAALRGTRRPPRPWPLRAERRLHAPLFDGAAFALASSFVATQEPAALRALGVVLANLEYRARLRGERGVAGSEAERALTAAWRAARSALPAAIWQVLGARDALAALEGRLAFEASYAPRDALAARSVAAGV